MTPQVNVYRFDNNFFEMLHDSENTDVKDRRTDFESCHFQSSRKLPKRC